MYCQNIPLDEAYRDYQLSKVKPKGQEMLHIKIAFTYEYVEGRLSHAASLSFPLPSMLRNVLLALETGGSQVYPKIS